MTAYRLLKFGPNDFGLFFLLLLNLILAGCGNIPGGGSAPEPEPFTFGGALYVTNGGDGSLLVFDPPAAASQAAKAVFTPRVVEGNVTPTRRFPESVTGPSGIFLDRSSDTLYVANTGQNAIAIYENASTLSPPVTPARIIAGDKTLLDKPFGVTYDAVNGRIFVANRDSNSIVVFDASCTKSLAGNIAPCRRLMIDGQTPPSFPRAVAVDTVKNLLYISTTGNDSVLIYENPGNIGAPPAQCLSDFSPCTAAPNRTISPHEGIEDESKLELPFGIFIDSLNDRLYVANTGLNKPAVLIYENASTLNGGAVPERVIAGLNTQLTVPAGIDVNAGTGRVFVINNNSPNNVNQTAGTNVDSPSLVVFNDILNACTVAAHLCNLVPNNRIGGDVNAASGTTLASPIGIAVDPARNIFYISNTGGNNILFYSLEGTRPPTKINTHSSTGSDITDLRMPNAFDYDPDLDRLYVANFGTFGFTGHTAAPFPVIVYDRVSSLHLENSPPSWKINPDPNFDFTRGFHIDKQRGYLLVLSASKSVSNFSVYCIPRSDGQFNANCTDPTKQWTSFPTNTATGIGSLTPPIRFSGFNAGLAGDGPKAMNIDKKSGDVYIVDSVANSIFVYNLESLSLPPNRTITGGNTGLNQPHGLAYDAERDILYVSNVGNNTLLSFDAVSTKGGNVAPDRIVTTITLAEADKLKKPISLSIDSTASRLFVIAAAQNAVFIYNNANTVNGEKAPDRKILAAAPTAFDFNPPQPPLTEIGGLLFKEIAGRRTLFVGQPQSPTCDTSNLSTCPLQAFYVFSMGGKYAPSQIWSGTAGAFTMPAAVGVDTTRDVLYVANQATNTLSILKSAGQVDVNVDPTDPNQKRDLSNIQLNSPAGLFLDSTENRLYISNAAAVLVFNEADILADGASPAQTIMHAQLSNPRGLKVDTTRKRLYVASTGNHSVLAFKVDGTAVFDAVLSGSETQLNSPIDLAVDAARDLLYVLNGGATEILVFEGASTLSGNVAPSRVIRGGDLDANNVTGAAGGNNFMVSPSALFVDSALDLLYLSDPGAESVYMFPHASAAQGQAEHKSLSGDNTGLNQPSALFVQTASP